MDVNWAYREIVYNPSWHYTEVDLTEGKNVDVVLKNTYSWKEIKTNSVDVLISGQAFEHMEFCWITMLGGCPGCKTRRFMLHNCAFQRI